MTETADNRAGAETDRRPGPINRFRHWRWQRAKVRRVEELQGYRMPVKVCPRGCEHVELARRELLTRTRLSGRVRVHTVFSFETDNCPKCGVQLADECPRCKRPVFAPVVGRCQFCGLPQPWARERRAGVDRRSIRRWREGEKGAHDPAKLLYTGDRGNLWVLEGDIARLDVDAVISNDDVDGQMWAEVARAIKTAAGDEVEQRAQDETPYPLGQAWITTAGDLQMEGIIHVASMGRHGEQDLNIVRECLTAALDLATEKGYGSVGTAAFGSGINMIKLSEWLSDFGHTMVKYLSEAAVLDDKPARDLSVVLVLFEPDNFNQALATLESAIREAWYEVDRRGTPVVASRDPAASPPVAK